MNSKNMLHNHWITLVVTMAALFDMSCALNCSNQSMICVIVPGDESFAVQVIEAAKHFDYASFTIYVLPGDYNSTNRGTVNFINFTNVAILKHPNLTNPVNIMCPEFTVSSYNGIGFEDSDNIEISGINFMNCGSITSGLYFRNTNGIFVSDSSFHHNSDNGIQIVLGNNVNIINCQFYSNVGLQPDDFSDFITGEIAVQRAVGLGLFFENQDGVNVTIDNCTFTSNIAYKTVDYDSSKETRPYGFIPFGNGGGLYLSLNNVSNCITSVYNCTFADNLAIHQGGAIVMLPVDSVNNTLDILECKFVENKALGILLRSLPDTITDSIPSAIDNFISSINNRFNLTNFGTGALNDVTFRELGSSGGFGGAIAVSLFGSVEYNILRVSNSHFSDNVGFLAGAIGFVVRDLLSSVGNGIDSNQALINNCTFDHNVALAGSAIAVASYSRVDTASLPIEINNCYFESNSNLRSSQLPFGISSRFGVSGTVVGLRFPVSFSGTNVFQSNVGGGVNMNHARVIFQGHIKFNETRGAVFGGAIRLELTVMHVLPNTALEFTDNSALRFGGAIATNNFIGGNDTTLILNNNCFIQYNIGGRHEYEPDKWNMTFIFDNNVLTDQNGQGQAFFADDIGQCVLGDTADNVEQVFQSSIFSNPPIFDFSEGNSAKSLFETAAHALILNVSTVDASLGEVFDLIIYAEDQNGTSKDAVYSYYAPLNLTANPSNIIVIDLQPDQDALTSFASVNKAFTVQKVSLVMRNAEQLQNSCAVNHKNFKTFPFEFDLSLIDSSVGQVVYRATVNSRIQCCHAAYSYSNITGECVFTYREGDNVVILRNERIHKKYIYIRRDRYGGYYDDGTFVTLTIPPSFQNCTQDGKLPGCIVMDDNPYDQCSQGRTGFLCGRCSNDSSQLGTALNLIECVSCEPWHIGLFIAICVSIVGVSLLIMYCNIGLPNSLKGFLFFIQVSGYVYRTGVKDGKLEWDFYLSRVFGFSLYFPLCISPNLDTVDVALLGFVTPLLMAMCIVTYIILARFFPRLFVRDKEKNKKSGRGIWFLVLIAYVYTADTCLNLLSCVQVYEPVEFKGRRVYYFDGELECYKGKHLPYGVTAVIISVVVLLSLPIYVLAVCFNFIKKDSLLIRNLINDEIELNRQWWTGYDLIRRLVFFVIFLLCENFNNDYTQFALTITALAILVITARMQPYTEKWVNCVEGLILLDLVLVTAYFLDNEHLPSNTDRTFAIILLILPFLYFFVYLIIKIVWKIRHFRNNGKIDDLTKRGAIKLKRMSALLFMEDGTSLMSSGVNNNEESTYIEFRDQESDVL